MATEATIEDHLKGIELRIHFWESKLTSVAFILEPSTRYLIEATIKDLKQLKKILGNK